MIYFVQRLDGGPIKIGTTIRLSVRLKQLEATCGHPLKVLGIVDGSFADERALHQRFDYSCVGGEWFQPGPKLLEFIERECRPWNGEDEVPSPTIYYLKGTPEYAAWLDGFHRKTYIAKTTLVRLGLAELAAKYGYPEPPEM